jgi:secreted PhoX family phosphatase
VWFTTKGDERIWEYDIATSTVSLRYQAGGSSDPVGRRQPLGRRAHPRTLFVAEDGGDMEIVMLRPDNSATSVVRLPNQEISEVAGPCFSPDGQRLYFSSQRGPAGPARLPLGVTYEVTGPFDELLGRV